jgi:hypothetical protein
MPRPEWSAGAPRPRPRRRRRARRWCGPSSRRWSSSSRCRHHQHGLRLARGDVPGRHGKAVEEARAGGGEVVRAGATGTRAVPGCRTPSRGAAGREWRSRRGSGRHPRVVSPASSSAARAAAAPMSAAPTSAAATRRSRIPVRVRIHSSDVSTIASSSALVRTRSGRWRPVRPAIAIGPACSSLALPRVGQLRAGSGCASPSPLSTACAATRIALRIARGGEPPWQMIVTPFTPSSGAPPYSV